MSNIISKSAKIAVLCGGMSSEREVSLRSGKNCYDALQRLGYTNSQIFDMNVDNINELKNFFGGTEKMNNALREINSFGERFLPHDAFDALCATPAGIQSVYKMMQSMEPHVNTDKNETKNLTDDDLRRMMRDPKYWRDNDVEYIRKIENGFKKLYS